MGSSELTDSLLDRYGVLPLWVYCKLFEERKSIERRRAERDRQLLLTGTQLSAQSECDAQSKCLKWK